MQEWIIPKLQFLPKIRRILLSTRNKDEISSNKWQIRWFSLTSGKQLILLILLSRELRSRDACSLDLRNWTNEDWIDDALSSSWRVEDDTAVSERSKGEELEGGPFEKQSSETTEVRLRQARRNVTEIEGVRACW